MARVACQKLADAATKSSAGTNTSLQSNIQFKVDLNLLA